MGFSMELVKAKRRIKELEKEGAEFRTKVDQLKARLTPPVPPTVKGTISKGDLKELLEATFPQGKDRIFFSDPEYEITAISEIRRFIDWDNTDEAGYVKHKKDCDDFAEALSGSFAKHEGWSAFPTTDIWGSYGGGHAFFIAVAWLSFDDRTPVVFYIEPQNDWEMAPESVEDMDLWLLAI